MAMPNVEQRVTVWPNANRQGRQVSTTVDKEEEGAREGNQLGETRAQRSLCVATCEMPQRKKKKKRRMSMGGYPNITPSLSQRPTVLTLQRTRHDGQARFVFFDRSQVRG